jgi:hypothetical protein
MASKRKSETKAPVEAAVSALLPDGTTLELAAPNEEQWDRYLEKLRRDQAAIGRREIVQTSCISHKPDPATGKIAALDKRPALITALSNGLDEYAGGGIVPGVDLEAGTVSVEVDGLSCVLTGPDIDAWERLQENMGDQRQKYGPTLRAFIFGQAVDESAARQFVAKKPAVIGPLVQAIGQVAGAGITVEVKKG